MKSKPDYVKPSPIGLRPRWLVNDERAVEIVRAIGRYSSESYMPPLEWIEELVVLMRDMKARERAKRGGAD